MQAFGTPFGAFGTAKFSRGQTQAIFDQYVGDCPVPTGIAGVFFTNEDHDGWCDCVYGDVPGLNALCKIKIGDKLPNGDTYLDPTMPWTATGKRLRGLTNDALGKLLQGLMAAAGKAVAKLEAEVGGQLGLTPDQIDLTGGGTDTTHPAVPLVMPNKGTTAREQFLMSRGGGVTPPPTAPPSGFTFPQIPEVSNNTLILGAAAVFAGWWFFMRPKTRISVSGFGGYGKRRRSRRLRY